VSSLIAFIVSGDYLYLWQEGKAKKVEAA